MSRRLYALAVQHGGRRLVASSVSFSDEDAERVVEHGLQVVERPAPENMIGGFPRRKVGGQITPRDTVFDHIEDGFQDASQIGARPTAFGGFRKHGVEILPLSVGEARFVVGVFHA